MATPTDENLRQTHAAILSAHDSKADKIRALLTAGVGVTAAGRLAGSSTGHAQSVQKAMNTSIAQKNPAFDGYELGNNSDVAWAYMNEKARELGLHGMHMDWENQDKVGVNGNRFQMNLNTHDALNLRAVFVYVKNGKVIKSKTSLELLDGEMNLIKKLKP